MARGSASSAAPALPAGFQPSPLAGVSPDVVPYTAQEMAAARAMTQTARQLTVAQGVKKNASLGGADAAMDAAADTQNDADVGAEEGTWEPYLETLGALPYAAAARGFTSAIVGAPNGPGALETDTIANPLVSDASQNLPVTDTTEPSPAARQATQLGGIASYAPSPGPNPPIGQGLGTVGGASRAPKGGAFKALTTLSGGG